MMKQQEYSWKDSNLALFGSDTERQVKKDAAKEEAAWAPVLQCTEPRLFVWRIEKFQVVEWSRDLHGKFFDGDSYIVLNVFKDEDAGVDKVYYDVHFWIGRNSTADEYGTAAYKTVELDTLLDDLPVQHREVQGHESALFRSYFADCLTYMSGGCPSGFNRVETREWTPRLFHFRGERRAVVVKEVSKSRRLLDSGDVYILDTGRRAYQWNGAGANKDERFKAAQYLRQLDEQRGGRLEAEVLDEADVDEGHEFYVSLTDDATEEQAPSQLEQATFGGGKRLFRLSNAAGSLEFSQISTGDSLSRGDVTDDDVFIIDNGHEIYVYVGENASTEETRNALSYAHKYANEHSNPLLPLTVVNSKAPPRAKSQFEANFD